MTDISDYDTISTEEAVHQTETEVITVDYDDKTYAFEIQDLSYNDKDVLKSDILDIDKRTQDIDLDLEKFKREYMKKMVVNTNVESFKIFVKNMPDPVGNALEEYVETPFGSSDDGEGN